MSNFITNSQTKLLKKRLLDLLSKGKELKFLVGFFYFSGLKELYEGIKGNPNVILKVLVGLNVDRTVYGLVEHGSDEEKLSDGEKLHKFFTSIKNSINTEQFDNRDFYEQVRFFLMFLKTDRLIIRKTYEPNHAKLYILKLQEEQVGRNTLFITGSSNLTASGLTHQQEFNVEISDYGFEEAEEYFDKLWEMGVPVTEYADTKKRLIEILEKETLIKEITPHEAYALVLKTYLDTFRGKKIGQRLIDLLKENGYRTYTYQLDAVRQGLSIIGENNGVIIADVVGLGKTVIACSIAFELKKRGVDFPPRIKAAKKSDKDELFAVIKKGRLFVHHTEYKDDSGPEIKGIEDCLERIRAEREEPGLPLSSRFWDEYEKIKNYREASRHRLTEQSIEQKAINNLKSLLKLEGMDVLILYKDFIKTLLEDILDYGTLSDYTLRRIANLDVNQMDRVLEEIKRLKGELGEDYLYREKERLKDMTKEIIIAIENRHEP